MHRYPYSTLKRDGRPEIFNTDQSSQFTSLEFTSGVTDSGVAIPVDRTGRCIRSPFTARLWCPLKYEAVCLDEFSDCFQVQEVISRSVGF